MSANGQLLPSELTLVQPGQYLRNDAAAVYLAMKRDGMPGGIATPIGAYRDNATQNALHNNPGAYGSSLPKSAIAVAPNGSHENGLNFDIIGGGLPWIKAWGAPYGASQRDAKGDPNCIHITPGVWTPPPVAPSAPNQRTTLPAVANLRQAHSAGTTPVVGHLGASTAYEIDYWLHGTPPAGSTNDVWFHVGGAFAWSGAFKDPSTAGITELEDVVVAPPVYVPPPVEEPVTVPTTVPLDAGPTITEVPDPAMNYTPPASPSMQPSGFVAFIQALIAVIFGSKQ